MEIENKILRSETYVWFTNNINDIDDFDRTRVWSKVDGQKGWKWTVLKMDGRAKVDGPIKSGRFWDKLDGHWRQSGRSWVKVVDSRKEKMESLKGWN